MARTQISLTNINVPSGFGNIPFNSIISNPSREMAGAQIISNTITSNRGRGVSLQSSNGVIANNTIVNMGPNQGISVGPNNQYGEAGFADNMLVRSHPMLTQPGTHSAAVDRSVSLGLRPASRCPWPVCTRDVAQ